tara:strand:- start:22691 stop:23611 length:921 start_codon:yes stop_codon:yes gene_type:complete
VKTFCTLSDINFLHYGITLYNSIKKNLDEDFQLFYLCTDDETYEKLQSIKLDSLVPISLSELKSEDALLDKAYNNPPSYEALNVANRTNGDAKAIQFFWCLAPYLSCHVIENYDVQDLLYVDSDICFFGDINKVYEEVGPKSIGIVRHRINYNPDVGEYNVGIVYFKNNLSGYRCVDWWKNCLLDNNNQYQPTHGICGDQKYLELFEPLFGTGNVQVIDNKVGHLAPWNIFNHQYSDNKIVWQGKPQDLTYFHFSNFKADFENDTYEPAPRHGITREFKLPNFVDSVYQEYFNEVKKARRFINEQE